MFAITKRKLPVLCFIIVLSVFMFSCASSGTTQTEAPLWITDKSAVYPDADYLTSVGYAGERALAEAEAVANLNKTIRQRVETESSATQSFSADSDGLDRSFSSTVQTSSLIEEIAGINIQDVWEARDGTVYAIALIDRVSIGNYYRQKVLEYEAAINGFINVMIDNPATFEGLNAIDKALSLAYENELYLDLLSIINPDMYKVINLAYKSAQTVEVLAQQEREKIYIGVFVEGDSDGRIMAALNSVLITAGFKTEQLASLSDDISRIPYVLTASFSAEPFEMTSSQQNKYVRFVLDTKLIDSSGKTLLPWNISGREAHFTEAEAAQRAIRTVEESINVDYLQEALKLIY
ncbi:MAG: LPP20 family lipoprotein [Spirochaetales bacterium]